MAKRPAIRKSKDLYAIILDGYRNAIAKSDLASKTGLSYHSLSKVYSEGWPEYPWALPIKDVLAEERRRVRAERAVQATDQRKVEGEIREKARDDAVRAQTQEAAASAQARANALAVANMIGRVVLGCIPLAERIQVMLKNPDYKISPREAMNIFRASAYVVRHGNEAIRAAFEIERLRLGEPTHILRLDNDEDMSTDDLVEQLASMHRTLARARGEELEEEEVEEIDLGDEGDLH